jgi:hypothetical protein
MNGSVALWDWRCAELVEGEHLSVDGSFIPANVSRLSRIPREQLPEGARVLGGPRAKEPVEETAQQQD